MLDLTQIPKPIVDLASQASSKPVASFSELISLKLFGKSIAKLKAEAENEYEKTKQQGEIERKTQEPFIVQIEAAKAYRQYSNLGNTLKKAIPFVVATENKVADDNDVFWGLLEHSKEISNDEMQELIAKIISGEYNAPGTYSMSALQTIKMLGKNELELFEKVCGFLIDKDQIPKEIFALGVDVKGFMKSIGIDFGSLQTLQSLGLFLPNEMTRAIENPEKKIFQLTYFDRKMIFMPENDNYSSIEVPSFFSLSMVGKQIVRHLNPKYVDAYYYWLRKHYKIANYKLNE